MIGNVLITGAAGRVGRVVGVGLRGLPITLTDRRELDAYDRDALVRAMAVHEQVIHLALPLRGPDWTNEECAASVRMVKSVLDAAGLAKVRRVLLPSSIRATSLAQLTGQRYVGIPDTLTPDTEYGRSRVEIEALANLATRNGMEVACIRLGAVCHPDVPERDGVWRRHWLSHEDCVSVFRTCLAAPVVPGRFALFYAVSDLSERILDVSNPYGWRPRTTSVGFRRILFCSAMRLNWAVRDRLRLRTKLKAALQRSVH